MYMYMYMYMYPGLTIIAIFFEEVAKKWGVSHPTALALC